MISRRTRKGRIFQRGRILWIAYYANGREIRESSHGTDPGKAQKLLEARIAERNRLADKRDKNRAARRLVHYYTDFSLTDLLSQSVRTLAKELRDAGRAVPGVYFLQSGDHVKIGYAANLEIRKVELQTGNPIVLKRLALLPGPRSLEGQLHQEFERLRVRGEWFRLEGALADFISALGILYD